MIDTGETAHLEPQPCPDAIERTASALLGQGWPIPATTKPGRLVSPLDRVEIEPLPDAEALTLPSVLNMQGATEALRVSAKKLRKTAGLLAIVPAKDGRDTVFTAEQLRAIAQHHHDERKDRAA